MPHFLRQNFSRPEFRDHVHDYSVLVVNGLTVAVDNEVADFIEQNDCELARSNVAPYLWFIVHDEHAPKHEELPNTFRYVRLADFIGVGLKNRKNRNQDKMYFPGNPHDPNDYRQIHIVTRKQLRARDKAIPKDIEFQDHELGFIARRGHLASQVHATPTASAADLIEAELRATMTVMAKLRGQLGKIQVWERRREFEAQEFQKRVSARTK